MLAPAVFQDLKWIILNAGLDLSSDITYELVTKKLREIVMSRGRRGTDKQEQVEMLTYLATVTKGPAQRFEVLSQLVSGLFDLNPSMSAHLKTSVWKKCIINLLEMLKLLEEHPNVKVGEGDVGGGFGTVSTVDKVSPSIHAQPQLNSWTALVRNLISHVPVVNCNPLAASRSTRTTTRARSGLRSPLTALRSGFGATWLPLWSAWMMRCSRACRCVLWALGL